MWKIRRIVLMQKHSRKLSPIRHTGKESIPGVPADWEIGEQGFYFGTGEQRREVLGRES
jgi:hypothetical protein